MRSEFEEATWDCMLDIELDTASRHVETAIINAPEFCKPQKVVREKKSSYVSSTADVDNLFERSKRPSDY